MKYAGSDNSSQVNRKLESFTTTTTAVELGARCIPWSGAGCEMPRVSRGPSAPCRTNFWENPRTARPALQTTRCFQKPYSSSVLTCSTEESE